MFIKYFFYSIKNKPIWHIIVLICLIGLLLVFFCANAFLINAVGNMENSFHGALAMNVDFNGNRSLDEMEEKIFSFIQAVPNVSVCGVYYGDDNDNSDYSYYYGSFSLFLFNDYESMVSYWTEERKADISALPTREQFENREKTVMLGQVNGFLDPKPTLRFADENHIYVGPNDDVYTVTGTIPNGFPLNIMLGAQPKGMVFRELNISFKDVITYDQLEQITKLAEDFDEANGCYSKLPYLDGVLSMRKNAYVIIVSVLMLVIIAFNMSIIFRQLAEHHRIEFAVYRICGFSKEKGVMFGIAEAFIISAVSAVCACTIFEFGLKDILSKSYGLVDSVFSLDYLILLSVGFVIISSIMLMVCVAPSLRKIAVSRLAEI
ncbi:MAG: hypothetical protein NC203_04635 [Firmicutes bacterium]|nr:hypothetical protein [[Eubacterium] siraeum]MCM1487636.1 hypothetical protein [Bacillota bacterium]